MPLTRRRLMVAASAVTAFVVTERGTRVAAESVAKAASAMRPTQDGTSTTRCALCGAADHGMLDARCPRANADLARRRDTGA
jgi:hypothetical protein